MPIHKLFSNVKETSMVLACLSKDWYIEKVARKTEADVLVHREESVLSELTAGSR